MNHKHKWKHLPPLIQGPFMKKYRYRCEICGVVKYENWIEHMRRKEKI